MFGLELKASQQRLEKEQKQRAEEAKRKAEQKKAAAERQKQRQLRLEEDQRQRRLAEAAAAEQERLSREALVENNNGVFAESRLLAVAADEEAMRSKGIKRAADKIVLPGSMGNDLMNMGAPKNGAMMFELTTPSGRTTHAGVLEFTEEEGRVALPRKVVRSLWGREATGPVGSVVVRYKVLEKGTFARLQPATVTFQADCGGEVREILERALMQHSCLTEGDWIEVVSAGKKYDMRVDGLEPEPCVSILDTDVEAEVAASMQNEAEFAAAEEEARRRMDAAAQEALLKAAEAEAEAQRARAAEEEVERLRQQKAASLPPEPEPSEDKASTTTVLIRLPDGSRPQRRFRISDPAQALFDWGDSLRKAQAEEGGGGISMGALEPGKYRLVAQHPRRVLEASQGSAGMSLGDVGIGSGQEVLLVEPLPQ